MVEQRVHEAPTSLRIADSSVEEKAKFKDGISINSAAASCITKRVLSAVRCSPRQVGRFSSQPVSVLQPFTD